MKVLLAKPVEALGETGEVVEVARGYARNYLFPQKLALEPTAHNIRRLEKARQEREIELRNREEQAQALQEQLNGMTFTFQRTAQAEGALYGSVRLEDIAAAVQEQTGHHLERDRVKLEAPIDTVGTFPVKLNIYKDIVADVTVVVEADGGSAHNEPAQSAAQPAASAQKTSVAETSEQGEVGQGESDAEGDSSA